MKDLQKLSVSIMKGAYLECDKLYDETLAKWKRKYKTSQALRNLMGTSGATGILSTDPVKTKEMTAVDAPSVRGK